MSRPDLCLEFANTRYWRGQPAPTESLNAPEDLAAWMASNVSKEARPLSRREFERALELRETIYRVFDATARGKPPAGSDLAALNGELGSAPPRAVLRRERAGFAWDVDLRATTAPAALAPVLWSAGDLLTGERLARVKRCANPECGWLFLDDSRAGRRRWCSMASCGNRAKAKRHYHRSREE
ncbi:MAG: ABATE domain-containing protein [Alphaproteobacteria bacterium]|nr:ABATE domain-containing protein [Alphaproteobacteria bacterium]MBV8412605.1 ABATE domain-containing protein [Alphaproteobacteria bacterium]